MNKKNIIINFLKILTILVIILGVKLGEDVPDRGINHGVSPQYQTK